eukprot:CAMPEP_0182564130 /NCGR_PEP_ID=MMETSP1324-20130603/6129_1 /TAXON_ID=236786 /ORGANISM="Florenciella sp., Strain RCC1587" /LENGTH=135 /DNA_ID=CAMNT_0024777503 /DNA_START=72 /DNA_END=479 /DNA_ORIENTATION=+
MASRSRPGMMRSDRTAPSVRDMASAGGSVRARVLRTDGGPSVADVAAAGGSIRPRMQRSDGAGQPAVSDLSKAGRTQRMAGRPEMKRTDNAAKNAETLTHLRDLGRKAHEHPHDDREHHELAKDGISIFVHGYFS